MSEVIKPITMEQLDTWIKALRSGEYAQGIGTLQNRQHNGNTYDYTYCCLGVLAHLNNEHEILASQGYLYVNQGDGPDGYCYLNEVTQETLARMNDHGSSFKTIAEYIEQNKESIYNDAQVNGR